jgi:hypothetical protein
VAVKPRLGGERARLAAAQASRQELALERERGQVADIEEMGEAWQQIASAIRSHLLAMPAKLSPILAPITGIMETRRALEAAIHESLYELVRVEVEVVPDDSS